MLDVIGNFLLVLSLALAVYVVILGVIILLARMGETGSLTIDLSKYTSPPSRWPLFSI